MKEFKVNAFERFIIRNHVALRRTVYAILLLAILAFIPWGRTLPIWAVLLIAFSLAIPIALIDLAAVFKLSSVEKITVEKLDLEATVRAADKMLAVFKPDQLEYIGAATLLKATALYDMGRADEAKNIVRAFLDTCDVKKPPYSQMAQNHTLLAVCALGEYDFKEFEFQKSRVERCVKDGDRTSRYYYSKNGIAEALELDYKIYSAESYNEQLENAVIERLEFKDGKPVSDKNRTLSYISDYGMLFEYFRRLNMTEKAHYYARKISRLANGQFEVWREAKEHLENEDKID